MDGYFLEFMLWGNYIRRVFFMKFRIAIWVLAVFVLAGILYGAESLFLQRELARKTVRLHVVANSDSKEDQAQKLVVRDAVLQQVEELTKNCKNAEDAKRVIGENLEKIAAAAKDACSYDVTVSLGQENFETRYYDTFTLPAGEYPSLRVRIGEADGKNWWCVVFPSLCAPATWDAAEEAALAGGFSQAETELISGGEESYRLRFKTLEWLQELKNLIS